MRFVYEGNKKWEKKNKLLKYTVGTYAVKFTNKSNEQTKSKFLNFLSIFFIIFFVISLVISSAVILKVGYLKFANPETIASKFSNPALMVPSLQKDSIQEITTEISDLRQEAEDQGLDADKYITENMPKQYFLFIPFYLFIPIIFLSTFVHEFGHYLMCRRAGVKVKEYGFGCLAIGMIPIIPFAFVEPTKKGMKEASNYNLFSIAAAGVSMNLLLAGLALLALIIFQNYFLYLALIMNVGLVMTNALPIMPLDGGLMVNRISPRASYITTWIFCSILVILLLA